MVIRRAAVKSPVILVVNSIAIVARNAVKIVFLADIPLFLPKDRRQFRGSDRIY
ncbi:hypothetical protein [Nostoc sp. LEGE 12447]|uniref:hypothetical protein n=1 Tax=Nostoc sp. LEGE 12447 TaxID=1828640 RepID=UPI001D142E99|nr:hypothetical protein [Nostoc sp. LEGE 12447]